MDFEERRNDYFDENTVDKKHLQVISNQLDRIYNEIIDSPNHVVAQCAGFVLSTSLLNRLKKREKEFKFAIHVGSLLRELGKQQDIEVIQESEKSRLVFQVLCYSCNLDEAIDLSILIHQFIGERVAKTCALDNDEFAKVMEKVLIQIEPEGV